MASILNYKGYQHYAPTYLLRKEWSDRVKTLEEPLFPGYVFVKMPETTLGGLLCSTPGVIRILGFGGKPVPLSDSEIDAVRTLTLGGKPQPTRFVSVGEKVKIKDGPFAGIVGVVTQIRNRCCLVVSVQLISQSVYVEVEEFQTEPVETTIQIQNALRFEGPRQQAGGHLAAT